MTKFEVTREISVGLQTCFICGKPLVDESYSVEYWMDRIWCCSEACVDMYILQHA